MAIPISADEVFEMACEIERNGAAFYRRAAEIANGPATQRLLNALAEMEDDHVKTFSQMRAEFAAEGGAVVQADDQAVRYLRALAGGRIFNDTGAPAEMLAEDRSPAEILRTGIGLEKDSIVFYVGMKRMVAGSKGAARMDGIIEEEMSHVAMLDKELASVGGR